MFLGNLGRLWFGWGGPEGFTLSWSSEACYGEIHPWYFEIFCFQCPPGARRGS
jgi:hypothetical protein